MNEKQFYLVNTRSQHLFIPFHQFNMVRIVSFILINSEYCFEPKNHFVCCSIDWCVRFPFSSELMRFENSAEFDSLYSCILIYVGRGRIALKFFLFVWDYWFHEGGGGKQTLAHISCVYTFHFELNVCWKMWPIFMFHFNSVPSWNENSLRLVEHEWTDELKNLILCYHDHWRCRIYLPSSKYNKNSRARLDYTYVHNQPTDSSTVEFSPNNYHVDSWICRR